MSIHSLHILYFLYDCDNFCAILTAQIWRFSLCLKIWYNIRPRSIPNIICATALPNELRNNMNRIFWLSLRHAYSSGRRHGSIRGTTVGCLLLVSNIPAVAAGIASCSQLSSPSQGDSLAERPRNSNPSPRIWAHVRGRSSSAKKDDILVTPWVRRETGRIRQYTRPWANGDRAWVGFL